jgi:hypothetical protein
VPLLAVLLSALALQGNPVPPTVTTGPSQQLAPTSAVVTGTITPGGDATTYFVQYGTSASYGLRAPATDLDAGAGTDPVDVQVPLSGLTPDTSYHYRIVARNAAGVVNGADRTLRTAAGPRVTTGGARDVSPETATLTARVDPNRLETTLRFEYGATAAYGQATPEQAVGSGSATLSAVGPVGGLQPGTRYHFRAVATNAAGIARGVDQTFTTAPRPTGVSVVLQPVRTVWGGGVTLSGRVSGRGIGGIQVGLERSDFPFSSGFRPTGVTVKAGATGAYSFSVPELFSATRLRVSTRSQVVAVSPVVRAAVATKVGLRTQRAGRARIRLLGSIWPAVPRARATLQRRSAAGRWIAVTRRGVGKASGDRSRYAFTVRRARRARTYRVRVVPRDAGAHVTGTSRARQVPARR